MYYNLDLSGAVQYEPYIFTNFVKGSGNTTFTEFYAQTKSVIGEKLTVNMGVNANYFQLNNVYSVDPRFGLNYNITDNHVLSFGYGKHSQLEELKIYFIKQENGLEKYPNQNLELAHAHHFVLGYEWLINENLRFKIEPYYQYLYNVPGIADSSWSMINFKQDWFFMSKLENNTFGKNIGVDITFERFLDNSFYYLVTASIFDSKYKGDDGIWRNTRYDKEVAVNILFGKEFTIKQNKTLGLNMRFNYMGGEKTTPILEEQSIAAKTIIYDYQNLFEEKLEDAYYLDLSITYRNNRPKLSTVWAFQIKNALATPINEGKFYNYKTNTIEESKTTVVVPVISYKIEF